MLHYRKENLKVIFGNHSETNLKKLFGAPQIGQAQLLGISPQRTPEQSQSLDPLFIYRIKCPHSIQRYLLNLSSLLPNS